MINQKYLTVLIWAFCYLGISNYITSQQVTISHFEEWDSIDVFELPMSSIANPNSILCPQNIARSEDSFEGEYSLELGDKCEDSPVLVNTLWQLYNQPILSSELKSLSFYYKMDVSEEYITTQKGCMNLNVRYFIGNDQLTPEFFFIENENSVTEWTKVTFNLNPGPEEAIIDTLAILLYCGYCRDDQNYFGGSSCNIDEMYFEIEEISRLHEFDQSPIKLYPNPARDNLFIKSLEAKSYVIHDALGERVCDLSILNNKCEVPLSELSNGLYFISLFNNENEIIMNEKFIKL